MLGKIIGYTPKSISPSNLLHCFKGLRPTSPLYSLLVLLYASFKLYVPLRKQVYYVKETMSLREAKHKKFALFCMPYYLRHGIEIFSDNSLPLDGYVLFWKLNKNNKQNAVKLIF